jgi:hypothetical protein
MSSGAEDMDDEPFKRLKDDKQEGSDKCGMSVRGKPPLLRLATRQGVYWIPCHCITGIDEAPDRFVIHFRATLGWMAKGEPVAMEGCWKATVAGKRLDSILGHLGMGSRARLNEGGTPSDSEPFVASIVLEPVEPVAFEAERA